jgi:NAD(P)-dependent dehydrogenase (short-subunit alcohol dehydrogenase family)
MNTHSLIIGGTRGIGRELAQIFAAQQHLVSVIGRRAPIDDDKKIKGVSHWSVDLLNKEALSRVLDEIVQKNGRLNNLVFLQRFKGEGDKWTGELETSLTATKNLIEKFSDGFAQNGSIVLVSSAAANIIADEQDVSYHVGKAGLNQMARYYAVKLGPIGIRVNVVSPGTILKKESRHFYLQNEKLMEQFNKSIPLRRMGTAEEVAGVISFLCSAQASFITGQTLLVDGGISLLSQETLLQKFAR